MITEQNRRKSRLFSEREPVTRVSPQAGSDKWKNNLSAATQNIINGINNTQADPPRLAAAAAAKWLNSVTASQPKYVSGLQRVSQAEWKAAAVAGTNRIADGAQKKQQKYTDFATQFYPYLDQGVQQVKSMDSGTFEARVQRAVAMMRWNRAFKRT